MIDLFNQIDFIPFLISFKLAFITTIILFFISIPLAWYLSQSQSKFKVIIEAITALPIVLPPSVIGFYILVVFSQNTALGTLLENLFGIKLIFSFTALVVASCFYSLPFMVQPIQSAFENTNKNILEASYVCGKNKLETIVKVALPNIKPALIAAIVITFAHTIGEFGVVLMVGGSIPGETKVASVAIYEMVEIMDYTTAHIYSIIMIAMSFFILLCVYVFKANETKKLNN